VAVTLMLPVIDAVAFAHAKGVVHRDIKPDNVFLARDERGVIPKVLDFGISKIVLPGADPRTTAIGVSMGTPAYMSPQQIQRFGEIDARTDVWALGVVLFELVTGRLPFRNSEHTSALFVEICSQDPVPLDAALPDAPPDLVRIVTRCLRREPTDRYPTAA